MVALSRRVFVRLSQALLTAVALPGPVFGEDSGSVVTGDGADRLRFLSRATFEQLVGFSFTVRAGSTSPAWLTLEDIEDLSVAAVQPPSADFTLQGRAPQTLEAFALRFRGTGEVLAQGTYSFQDGPIQPFELFVVPAQTPAYAVGTLTYTAIINRLAGPTDWHPPIRQRGTVHP